MKKILINFLMWISETALHCAALVNERNEAFGRWTVFDGFGQRVPNQPHFNTEAEARAWAQGQGIKPYTVRLVP